MRFSSTWISDSLRFCHACFILREKTHGSSLVPSLAFDSRVVAFLGLDPVLDLIRMGHRGIEDTEEVTPDGTPNRRFAAVIEHALSKDALVRQSPRGRVEHLPKVSLRDTSMEHRVNRPVQPASGFLQQRFWSRPHRCHGDDDGIVGGFDHLEILVLHVVDHTPIVDVVVLNEEF